MICPLGPTEYHRRRPRSVQLLGVLLACSVILAACGTATDEVGEDRRFANEPVTEQPVTPTQSARVGATPVSTGAAVTASPETLLRARGTPDTLYTVAGGALLALSVEEGEGRAREIPVPSDREIVDLDGSPSGDRVAVLTASPVGGRFEVVFYQADGEQIGGAHQVFEREEVSATPEAASAPRFTIRWTPQGDAAIVVSPDEVVHIGVGDEPEAIDLGEIEGDVVTAAVSPEGMRILFQAERDDGSQHVYVRDLENQKTREVKALRTGEGMELQGLQWLPDGSGVVFVRGQVAGGVALRGQLYVYSLSQEVPQLVATSGQGGQLATITDVEISPNGQSVAYVISVLDGEEWAFHSMWVRSINGTLSYQVPVEPRGVVTDLAWAGRGIVWDQRSSMGDASGDIILARQGEGMMILLSRQEAGPQATPHVSPGAGADGTPVATPLGTPPATAAPSV